LKGAKVVKNQLKRTYQALLAVLLVLGAGATPSARVVHAAQPTDLVLEVFAPNPLNLYAQPSFSAVVLRPVGNGNRMTWNGVYQSAEGRNWMFVEIGGQGGWLSPNSQEVGFGDPTHITAGIDRSTVITPATNTMSLYQAPGRGNPILTTLPVGTQLQVIDGPAVVDLYTWWPVQVSGTATRGWVVDTGRELRLLTPLQVYGYQVCDNFDLKTFGAPNWDSVLQVFPRDIPRGERVLCLASAKLRGLVNPSPVVAVLTRAGVAPATTDTLRVFEQTGRGWVVTYQASSGQFNRTERLSLHNLAGDGVPVLLWAVRADGTGGILNLALLRYAASGTGQLTSVLLADGIYKGSLQINGRILSTLSAEPLPNEPNCCPSTARRIGYQFNPATGLASPIVDNTFRIPAGVN
jgi:hypothetical protein